jgi:hypothetical protein
MVAPHREYGFNCKPLRGILCRPIIPGICSASQNMVRAGVPCELKRKKRDDFLSGRRNDPQSKWPSPPAPFVPGLSAESAASGNSLPPVVLTQASTTCLLCNPRTKNVRKLPPLRRFSFLTLRPPPGDFSLAVTGNPPRGNAVVRRGPRHPMHPGALA